MANEVAVSYTYTDGWISHAVGEPGACSWHGGVAHVTYWDPDTGTYSTY